MKRASLLLIDAVLVGLVIGLGGCGLVDYETHPSEATKQEILVGMSQIDVAGVIGAPSEVKKSATGEIWEYRGISKDVGEFPAGSDVEIKFDSAGAVQSARVGGGIPTQPTLQIPNQENSAKINSYAECAAAGFPVLRSYPGQCVGPDGRRFVEQIPGMAKDPFSDSSKEKPKGCINRCGDGQCDELVCQAVGCPCAESPASCPKDCH